MAETEMVEFEGLERPALVFRWSGSSNALGVFTILGLGVFTAFGLTSAEPGDIAFGTVLVLIDVVLLFSVLTTFVGNRYVALLSEGILQCEPFRSILVPRNTIV